jgi:hypothetical protein
MAAGDGSMTLVLLLAAACCLTPWMTIRAHQQNLLLSFLAVAAGAAVSGTAVAAAAAMALAPGLAPALGGQKPSLMEVMAVAWCLWVAATTLCLLLCCGDWLKKKGS